MREWRRVREPIVSNLRGIDERGLQVIIIVPGIAAKKIDGGGILPGEKAGDQYCAQQA